MRKRILQTIVLTIVGLWLSISVSALISRSVWSVFRPPELIGEKAVGIDIENIGIRVTEAYFEKLKGCLSARVLLLSNCHVQLSVMGKPGSLLKAEQHGLCESGWRSKS